MKKLLLLIPLLSGFLHAQDEGLEISAYIWLAHIPEKQALREMEEDETYVKNATDTIAYKTAGIFVMKELYLNSLTNISGALEDAKIIEDIAASANRIAEYQTETFSYEVDNPLAIAAIAQTEAILIENTISFGTTVAQIMTEGQDNMMNAVDRLKFLELVKTRILKMEELSRVLAHTIRYQSYHDFFMEGNSLNGIEVDYQAIIQNAQENYDVIFNPE